MVIELLNLLDEVDAKLMIISWRLDNSKLDQMLDSPCCSSQFHVCHHAAEFQIYTGVRDKSRKLSTN